LRKIIRIKLCLEAAAGIRDRDIDQLIENPEASHASTRKPIVGAADTTSETIV